MNKKLILTLLVALCYVTSWAGENRFFRAKTEEQLVYNVYFHIGFIWAKAGDGTLSMYREMDFEGHRRLHCQLAAKSLSVVEHIMRVRDTLDCYFTPEYLLTEFSKRTHEGKYNSVETNVYDHSFKDGTVTSREKISSPYTTKKTPADVAQTTGNIHRWRQKGSEPADQADTVHVVSEPAYDMLSLFYVMRKIDYSKMKKGDKLTYTCFAGLKNEPINVEFVGEEDIQLRNGRKAKTYAVNMRFATKGQDSTPVQVWFERNEAQLPLRVVIGLSRIGSVQCEIQEGAE